MKRINEVFAHVSTKLVVTLAVGVFSIVLPASAKEPDIPAASPAGSCCRIDGKEGASTWSEGFQAWSCKIGAITPVRQPGVGPTFAPILGPTPVFQPLPGSGPTILPGSTVASPSAR